MKPIVLAILIGIFSTPVSAHSKLASTVPADGAVVSLAPEVLSLRFAKAIRLVRVDMTHKGQPAAALDLGQQTGFVTEFSVPVPDRGDGQYLIEWRGLGVDGHAMQGTIRFQVK